MLIILFAMIGIGWGVDQIFEGYADNSNKDMIESYKNIGQQLANGIDTLDDPHAFVEQWNKNQLNKISLTEKKNFPLPVELERSFTLGEILVLEAADKLTLHYFLGNNRKVLTFHPEELRLDETPAFISFILTLLFYLGILFFIFVWLYPVIARLRLLRQTAIKFGAGNLSNRIETTRTSYIGDIEAEFNRMAQKIEMLVSDNKLISSAVSHDLRTPLSRLRFGIDILSDTSDPKERTKYQEHLSRDIDEMQALVEVLLNYARLEQSFVSISMQSVDLSVLLKECVDYYIDANPQIKIELLNVRKESVIKGDYQYLGMLLKNIINNAIEHGKSKVLINMVLDSNHIVINIDDDGPGVPLEQHGQIFKPFIKGEIKEKGYGMGLAIADRIVQWHGGKIQILESSILSGARFKIIF